ncbi:hypothetical protein EDD18DRAFT_1110504 [Armillaria luteobubalina]|uniref:CxC2-like cysteine cluster KDZ transposase-associated domain-containing protein n=1 Tax=Armillaria luteobubalina TaxID=153913 RepID=A0AA39UHV0_9AGAR|nr:hypothetical protein EDD18DRAFT_1110504 [Armillaria luteobubalina]
MMEQPRNQNFKHATGFGPEEEDFLRKNAIGFHLFDTQHTFFANVWLDFIWKDFVLYWPPEDRSDEGLSRHRQVYPPGPSENRHSTILCSERPHPVFIIPDPTSEELKEVEQCCVRHAARSQHIQTQRKDEEVYLSLETPGGPSRSIPSLWLYAALPNQSDGASAGTAILKNFLPQKKTTIFSPDYDDLLPLPPHFLNTSSVNDTSHEQYHLDPEVYALAMAGDMENIVTAPRRCIYSRCEAILPSVHGCIACGMSDTLFSAYFDKVPLRTLGMRYQVGHIIGEVCPHPHPVFGDHFTIIDTNGIHNVALDFCSCICEHPLASQLQRAWLFPMTGREPRTAVTTVALEQFQMLTFMGKISAYEYYYSLVRLTDNTNTKTPLDNYSTFVQIVCEWSFIRQLKRAGIGNDPGGWKNAKPASCAVECLACPQPGINIPKVINPNDPDAWLYTLYLGMDGNFRLERFDVSSKDKDPGLGGGLAYSCVATTKPQRVIIEHGIGLRISQLVGLEGLSAHDMSLSSLCPWLIYVLVKFPKFHLPGHIEECQEKYCMSFHTKVGNNDGEAPERVAASMREMGPGHRREKLDQHFGDYNWQKNIAQGNSMLQKLKDAIPKASEHEDRFKRFMKSLPQQDVAKWTEIVEAWEADRTKLNPFTWTVANKTEAAMRLQFAQEDTQDELAGLDSDEFHTTSPKDMISQGIQLEGSQRRIAQLNKDLGLHSTDLQRAQVLEKSNHLRHHIESWFIVEEVHMPMKVIVGAIGGARGAVLAGPALYFGGFRCNQTMSWIWYSAHLGDMPGGVEECLCIEWCKTRAQAHQWQEECKLLSAEMGRVKQTLDYEAVLWLS